MRRSSMCGTWEIPEMFSLNSTDGEGGVKVKSQKACPKVTGKSDRIIVPKKPANKVEKSRVELVEGRNLTKGELSYNSRCPDTELE